MTGSNALTPQLMAQAISVALNVKRNSWVPKTGKYEISNAAAVKATCEVLDIDPAWHIFIYYAIYLPTRSLEEWANEMTYKDGDISWGKDEQTRLPLT